MGEIMSATMAYMGLQAFSGLLKAQGYNAQGKAQAAAHQFNSDIAYRNYEYSLIEAQQRKFVDDLQILDFIDEQEKLLDAVQMSQSSNGWVATSDTPLKVMMANAMDMDEDLRNMAYKSGVAQTQIKEQGIQDKLQSQLSSMYGQQARAAGRMNSMTSLLGTASNIAMIKAYG